MHIYYFFHFLANKFYNIIKDIDNIKTIFYYLKINLNSIKVQRE
jgi:hypothetical protein